MSVAGRITAPQTAEGQGRRLHRRGAASKTVTGAPVASSAVTRWPRQAVLRLGVVLAPVTAAGFGAAQGPANQRVRHRVQIRGLPRLDARFAAPGSPAVAPMRASSAAVALRLVALRRTPAPAVIASLTAVAADGASNAAARSSGTGSPAAGKRSRQIVGDPRGEDQPFEQAVRRQPIRAMHSGAGHFAARIQAGHVRSTEQVGAYTTTCVVRPWRDRNRRRHRIDTVRATRRGDGGETLREIRHVASIEQHMVGAGRAQLPDDRLGHDVARRQLGERMLPDHKPRAMDVDQHRAFAAYRLGNQRLLTDRVGSEPQDGRVELHELHVGDRRTCAQRERDAVAGSDRRIRGRREHLAEPAGRQHNRATERRTDTVAAAGADHVQGDTAGATVSGLQQVDDERVLDDLDAFGRLHRSDQRPLDFGAGGIAAGVRDATAKVTAFAGEREITGVVEVEPGAELDEFAHQRQGLR